MPTTLTTLTTSSRAKMPETLINSGKKGVVSTFLYLLHLTTNLLHYPTTTYYIFSKKGVF